MLFRQFLTYLPHLDLKKCGTNVQNKTRKLQKKYFQIFASFFILFVKMRQLGGETEKAFLTGKKSCKAPIFWLKYTTVKYLKLIMFKLDLCIIK